jgi:hypothetical protein
VCEEILEFEKAEVKFTMCADPLFMVEENRKEINQDKFGDPSYHAELDFRNIKSISYVKKEQNQTGFADDPDSVNIRLLLQLNLPCVCYKRYFNQKGRPTRVRSPFNMLCSEKTWEGADFLNYWNLSQTFLIEGQATYSMFYKFLDSVKHYNSGVKISEGTLKV